MQLGSVEAGGTKFVCAVGNEDYRILDRVQFPTTTPEETLQKKPSTTSNNFQNYKRLGSQVLAQSNYVGMRMITATLLIHQSRDGRIPRLWADFNRILTFPLAGQRT